MVYLLLSVQNGLDMTVFKGAKEKHVFII